MNSDIEYNINLQVKNRLTIKHHKCKKVLVQDELYYKLVTSQDLIPILYSPGYGGTWSAHVGDPAIRKQLVLDSRLIKYVASAEFIENFKSGETKRYSNVDKYLNLVKKIFSNKLGEEEMPDIDAFAQLSITFIPNNTLFRINEYDGSESVEILNTSKYIMS